MGQSQSIQEKAEADKAFRDFMIQLEKDSQAEQDRINQRIQDLIKSNYSGNGWDHARLFGKAMSDYQNYDDWSLDRVKNIINSIGTALSMSDYPSSKVPGSDSASKDTVDTAKEFAGAFAGDYSLTIARVTALITGALSQFSTASTAKRNATLQDLPMTGGLHLFFGCSGNVFERNDFFRNQFIGSFEIVFEAQMSAQEARAIGLQQILATTQKELDFTNRQIVELRQRQMEELTKILQKSPPDMALYRSTKTGFDLALDDFKADRDKVQLQFDKYKNVTDTVDEVFERLDLPELDRPSVADPLALEDVFTGWEENVARRYAHEKLAAEAVLTP